MFLLSKFDNEFSSRGRGSGVGALFSGSLERLRRWRQVVLGGGQSDVTSSLFLGFLLSFLAVHVLQFPDSELRLNDATDPRTLAQATLVPSGSGVLSADGEAAISLGAHGPDVTVLARA